MSAVGTRTVMRLSNPVEGSTETSRLFEVSYVHQFPGARLRPARSLAGWCERGDSNSHGLPHWILSPARLPIPPLSRAGRSDADIISAAFRRMLERNGRRSPLEAGCARHDDVALGARLSRAGRRLPNRGEAARKSARRGAARDGDYKTVLLTTFEGSTLQTGSIESLTTKKYVPGTRFSTT